MATAGLTQLRLALLSLLLLQAAAAAFLDLSASVPQLGTYDIMKGIQTEVETMNTYLADLSTAIDNPASTTQAPATTSAAPATTSAAPATTSAAPATTSAAPATTSAAPATTSAAPATTSAAPATTSAAPATTSAAPAPTSTVPATTSAAPAPTSTAPATTSTAPATTSAAPAPTSTVPATTSAAPVPTSTAPATTSEATIATTGKGNEAKQIFISRQLLSLGLSDSGCENFEDINSTLATATKALELVTDEQLSNATRDTLHTSNSQLDSTVSCVKTGKIVLDENARTAVKATITDTQTHGKAAADTINNFINPTPPPVEDDSGFRSATIALGVLLSLSLVAVAAMAVHSRRQAKGGSMN